MPALSLAIEAGLSDDGCEPVLADKKVIPQLPGQVERLFGGVSSGYIGRAGAEFRDHYCHSAERVLRPFMK